MMPGRGLGTKYHLEVKSTQAECNAQPMILSPNQINKVSCSLGVEVDTVKPNDPALDGALQRWPRSLHPRACLPGWEQADGGEILLEALGADTQGRFRAWEPE